MIQSHLWPQDALPPRFPSPNTFVQCADRAALCDLVSIPVLTPVTQPGSGQFIQRGRLRMTDALTIEGHSEDLDVFDCPNCKETISTSADVCRFCGAKVNHEAAQKAAHLLAQVDQACSDASFLRYTAMAALCLPLGLLIGLARNPRFIEVVGFHKFSLGFCLLVLAVSLPFPIWSLRWWSKNAHLATDDEDFQSARDSVRTAGVTAVASFLIFGLLLCLALFKGTR